MASPRCICGCGWQHGVQWHHVVTRQELRRAVWRGAGTADVAYVGMGPLEDDRRNLVPVNVGCHAAHHARSRPLRLSRLPNSVFEFAAEVLGPGRAYEYLRRYYAGLDARLDALLEEISDAD